MVAPPFAVLEVRAVFIGAFIFGFIGIFFTSSGFFATDFLTGAFFAVAFFAGAFLLGLLAVAFFANNLLKTPDFLAGFPALFFELLAIGFLEFFFVGTAPKAMGSRLEKPLSHTMDQKPSRILVLQR